MLFKTHVAFGLFIYFVLFSYLDSWFVFLIGLLIGVVIVDLDCSNSRFGRILFFRPFQFFIKHRGMFHSLFFGFVLMIIFGIFSTWFAFGFIVGFLSHLFLDFLTYRGIMIFWPFFKKRFGMGLRSGGVLEDIIFVCFLLIDFLLFYFIIRDFLVFRLFLFFII